MSLAVSGNNRFEVRLKKKLYYGDSIADPFFCLSYQTQR